VKLLIGTTEGVFVADKSGTPVEAKDLAGRNVRALRASKGSIFAGSDAGVFRSRDGGCSWQVAGVEGKVVWDLAAQPGQDQVIYAGAQPAAIYRSCDGGASWTELETIHQVPGSERWCLPRSNAGARARTIVLDPGNPQRFWVGLEVGGVLATTDGGASWSCVLPGGDPDIHVMVGQPGNADVLYATTGFGRPDDDPTTFDERIAGVFSSQDGGRTWHHHWEGLYPRYTRHMCIDPRPPYAVTVGSAPSPFSSYRDPDGAQAVLFRSDDGGETWCSLGDDQHSPSAANFSAIQPAPEGAGGVLVGTDTGEVWRVSAEAEWTLLASGLPMVQATLALD
jgi:photosystem II stability/assembly factor-like uncharacterized protein